MAPAGYLPPVRGTGSRPLQVPLKLQSQGSLVTHPNHANHDDGGNHIGDSLHEHLPATGGGGGGTARKALVPVRTDRKYQNPGVGRRRSRMRVFVTFAGVRVPVDVRDDETVGDVKRHVRDQLNLPQEEDQGPGDRKVLALHHQGAELADDWSLVDVAVRTGAALKATLRAEVMPQLYLTCAYSGETLPLLGLPSLPGLPVAALRSAVTRRTGVPVGVFRMVTRSGTEMYDGYTLFDYRLEEGDVVGVETWDGWGDFLNLCMLGYACHVMEQLSRDELVARYQLKVALHLAAHHGNVDLAASLVRTGIRPDEAIGEHPARQWCKGCQSHVDARNTAVHVAAEQGQLTVLRYFLNHNPCNALAKDGNGRTPLSVALRRKQNMCASFLLAKQWSKVDYPPKTAIGLSIFAKMRRWAERARGRVLLTHGLWKSSLSVKNSKRYVLGDGALIGQGVLLDGFNVVNMMSSKPRRSSKLDLEQAEDTPRTWPLRSVQEEDTISRDNLTPQRYFQAAARRYSIMLPRLQPEVKVSKRSLVTAAAPAADGSNFATSTAGVSESGSICSIVGPPEREFHIRFPPISKVVFRVSSNALVGSVAAGPCSKQGSSELGGEECKRGDGSQSFQESLMQDNNRRDFGWDTLTEKADGRPMAAAMNKQQKKITKKKKKLTAEPDLNVLLAKTNTVDAGIPLPLVSRGVPRPFVRASAEITRNTLSVYEKYRGLQSRDYAIKCLSVATTFSEKPWLHQVRQAMDIATRGVHNTLARKGHLFSNSFSEEQVKGDPEDAQCAPLDAYVQTQGKGS